MPEKRICGRKGCNNEIEDNKYNPKRQKFCSRVCGQKAYRERYVASDVSQIGGLAKGKVGAISELQACIDLVSRGYDVFRAVAQNCPCDLIAMKEKILIRVEVKTAIKRKDGILVHPCILKPERADVLALVFDDRIEYRPSLESL